MRHEKLSHGSRPTRASFKKFDTQANSPNDHQDSYSRKILQMTTKKTPKKTLKKFQERSLQEWLSRLVQNTPCGLAIKTSRESQQLFKENSKCSGKVASRKRVSQWFIDFENMLQKLMYHTFYKVYLMILKVCHKK